MTDKEAAQQLAESLKNDKKLRAAHERMDEQWKQYKRSKRKSRKDY